MSETADFTGYTREGVDPKEQKRLADVHRKLNDRGLLLLSNSDTPFIRTLYSDFKVNEVDAQRAINCKGSERTGDEELIISNYSNSPRQESLDMFFN